MGWKFTIKDGWFFECLKCGTKGRFSKCENCEINKKEEQ